MNLMPILYTPRTRYTSDTNVLVPVIVNFLRAGAITMLDWVTLRFIDHAPIGVWIATGVISLAILAVLQSKDWLDFKGKRYFWGPILTLLAAWAITVGYAYWYYYSASEKHGLFPTADEIAEAIARNLPKPPPTPAVTPPDDADFKAKFAKQSADLQDAQRDARRWTFIYNLRNGARAPNGEFISCKYTLVLGGGNEAWTVWTALQPMLDLAHWSVDQRVPSGTSSNLQLPRGLVILTGGTANAFSCGTSLGRAFGEAYPQSTVQLKPNSITSQINLCSGECVELDIGG